MSKIDWYLRTNLKFRHLQLLVTLDELRHIGRTAQYLNVSQPAISKTLSQFEEGFNIKLFHRTTRTIRPTEAGTSLIKHARVILKEISDASNELLDITEGRVSRISLGILPSASPYLVPKLIAKLQAQLPATKVTVVEGATETLLPQLRTGNMDIVIGNLTNKIQSQALQTQLLYQDPLVVVVHNSHPLSTKQHNRWEDIANYPMVLPPKFAITRTAVEEFLTHKKINISPRYVESLSTLSNIGVLCETQSVGFLAKSVAQYFQHIGLVNTLNLELPNIQIDIGMIWLKNRKDNASQQTVLSLLEKTCQEILTSAAMIN